MRDANNFTVILISSHSRAGLNWYLKLGHYFLRHGSNIDDVGWMHNEGTSKSAVFAYTYSIWDGFNWSLGPERCKGGSGTTTSPLNK